MGYYEIPPIETFDVGKWAEEELRKMCQKKFALKIVEEECKKLYPELYTKKSATTAMESMEKEHKYVGLTADYIVADEQFTCTPKIHKWPENMLKPLPTTTYNFQIKDLLDLDTFAKTWNGITNDIIEEGRKAMKKFNDNMNTTMGIKGTHQDPLNQKEVEEEYYEFDDLVKRIVFNPPATIVFWFDGTKTIVKCGKDQSFNPYYGFCAALAKRMLGHNCAINRHIDEYVAKMDRKAALKYEDDYRKKTKKTKEPKEVEYECYETTYDEDLKMRRFCDTCAFEDYGPSDYPCRKCLHCNDELKVSYYKVKEDSKNG